jgi:Acetyltransferases, including N-acetylases of ribosomal proteins
VTVLRDVAETDLDVFYEQQLDPEATAMAIFPARDREAFDAHWRRLLADDSLVKRTIVDAGAVAGNIGCWKQDGRLLVGYWVGREFWGRGLATAALAELVTEIPGAAVPRLGRVEQRRFDPGAARSAASSRSSATPSATRTLRS